MNKRIKKGDKVLVKGTCLLDGVYEAGGDISVRMVDIFEMIGSMDVAYQENVKAVANYIYMGMEGFRVKDTHLKKCALFACELAEDYANQNGHCVECGGSSKHTNFWNDVRAEIESYDGKS